MKRHDHDVIVKIRHDLTRDADEKTKNSFQRFFKEKVQCYGVKSAAVFKISKAHFRDVQNLGKKEVFRLCKTLLKSGYCEEAWIAANWADWFHDDFEPTDFGIFENWIGKYIDNWAECDTLCNHTVGSFLERYPRFLPRLMQWTKSPNRWLRRAAAVSLIIPAKKGLYLKEIFAIADRLLNDQDDMVQKGYGWMLKEASRRHQTEVFNYVLANKQAMPRTALRYAIEKMPPNLKKSAMAKE